jgi:hypothetical protein
MSLRVNVQEAHYTRMMISNPFEWFAFIFFIHRLFEEDYNTKPAAYQTHLTDVKDQLKKQAARLAAESNYKGNEKVTIEKVMDKYHNIYEALHNSKANSKGSI